jgi:predicted Co/Zn/Cd cation transporter (cation efflux family)
MAEDSHFERRSLAVAKWANLVMGVAGVVAAFLSRSDALLVDGLYSGVNFASAIVAAKVGAAVSRPPDRRRPFGYEAEESLYVTFRSLVLIGVIAFAGLNAVEKTLTWATGGAVPELIFGPILVYVALMVAICLGLAALHHHNWKRAGRRSAILKTETRAALVDGTISAGAGGALLAVPLLKGTALAFVIPIADAIVVLGLAAFIVREPARMFMEALREVAGEAAEASVVEQVRGRTEGILADSPYELLEVAVTRLGRSHFVGVYLKPEHAVSAAELDTLRERLQAAYGELLGIVRTELIVTQRQPFE